MTIKEKTIVTNSEWFDLCLFGDWHYGSADCDSKKVEMAVDFLSKKPKDKYGVILLGDLIENVLPGSKGTPFELSESDPIRQQDKASELVNKFKNIVLTSVEGNHELRSRKRSGNWPMKDILYKVYKEQVDEYYLEMCGILNLQFKSLNGKKLQKYRIFVTHGNGNATSLSGKISKIHTLRDRADADIYVQGHIHQKLGFCDYIVTDKIIRKRIFASCSSYLFEASYAEEFGFRPTDYGINKIHLNTKESNIIGSY